MRGQDEKSTVRHFRTGNRFICQDGKWWFSTREGEEGPFDTREAAELGLKRFIDYFEKVIEYQAEQAKKVDQIPRKDQGGDPTVWDRQIDSL